ncbi:MAG: asparaginase, partial [Firmicutes bacterium]|nr:asparaginase [Bacillota bacterium]
DDLQCGTHRPLNRRVAKEMLACGAAQSTLHNTCSGKHAGMLALCRYWNYPLKDYTSPEHPLQRLMLKTISTFSGTEEKDIKIGIDGCGVPVFALPLANIATAYARLATGRGNNAALYESSCKRVVQAIVNHPQMIGGEKIICTTLIKQGRGKLLAKSGTEAVYCLAHLEKGIGCAFKIEDGAVRALAPTAIEILQQLCWLKEEDLAGLSSLHKPLLKNHSGTIIGCITPHFCLSKNNC